MIKKVLIDKANRLYQFPPDIFSFMRETGKKPIIKKAEIIDLGRFNWNIPFDEKLKIDTGSLNAAKPDKLKQLKEALADWFYELHKIRLNPLKEIFIGGRISSMILSTALAFVDSSDIVFVPELGLPSYRKAVTTAGGEPVSYAISNKNEWLPNFERLSTRLGRVARLLFLNSPHNPTGTVLSQQDLENLIWVAARENIALVNDAAYQSVSDAKKNSLIGIKDGKRVGVELHSFSYTFGLPHLPFGFAIGYKELIEGITQTSSLAPAFIPDYYVDLALDAIRKYPSEMIQQKKKDFKKTAVEASRLFELISLENMSSGSIPFLWAKLPRRKSSHTFASQLYRKYRIICAPGSVFGDTGEGYLRFSLTASPGSYTKAYDRIKKRLRLLKKEQAE